MATNYSIKPAELTLAQLKDLIANKELFPSRILLKEHLEDRFQLLETAGITTLAELNQQLSNTKKIALLAQNTQIPEEYLILLKRESNSYLSKPVNISLFAGINQELQESLSKSGIINTKQFYEKVNTPDQRYELAVLLSVPQNDVDELFALSDLSRIWGVGPVFAHIVFGSGIHSVKAFKTLSAEEAFQRFSEYNKMHQLTTARFSANDMRFCIQMAELLED